MTVRLALAGLVGLTVSAVRVRVYDKLVEAITTLENIRRIDDEAVGSLATPAPYGSLLVTRDIGTQEIYALTIKWP